MTSALSLKSVCLIHRYAGQFFALTILFCGWSEMFSLHETARGSVPPNILVHLSQLHKKVTLYLPPRKVAPPNSVKSDGAEPDGPQLEIPKPTQTPPAPPPPNSLPMKIFFLPHRTCTCRIDVYGHPDRLEVRACVPQSTIRNQRDHHRTGDIQNRFCRPLESVCKIDHSLYS
jgi:hypothetical protein